MARLRLLLAAVVGGILLQCGSIAADGNIATYCKEAMDNLVPLLKKAEKDGYVMDAKTGTIIGGWLQKGSGAGNEPWISMLVLRNCDPNKSYRVIASGDNDVRDLDVQILDPAGKEVTKDVTVLRDAEVTFRPTRQQDYTIRFRLYDSKDNSICIGAVLVK